MPWLTGPVGTQGNAWNGVAVLTNGVSNAVDCKFQNIVSIFGHLTSASKLNVQYSQDGINFYTGPTEMPNANSDFDFDIVPGARYVRLQAQSATTITATIAGKAA